MGFFANRFSKVGPGVSKDEKPKRRFFLFFELYFRFIGKIVITNLVYSAFTLLPIILGILYFNNIILLGIMAFISVVLYGPATAAMMHVLRNLSQEEHSYGLSDFWEHFRKNIKQGIIASLVTCTMGGILGYSLYFYFLNMNASGGIYTILFGVSVLATIIFIFANYYLFLMIVTLNLKLKDIFKNALIFSILGIKVNFINLIVLAIFVAIMIFVPIPINFIIYAIIIPATFSFLVAFNCYPLIKKYSIDPFYETEEDKIERENEEAVGNIFSDASLLDVDFSDIIDNNNSKKDTEL